MLPDLICDTKEILKKMCLGFKVALSALSGCIRAAALALTSDSLHHLSANLALLSESPEKRYHVSNIPTLKGMLRPAKNSRLQLQMEAGSLNILIRSCVLQSSVGIPQGAPNDGP